MKIIITGGTGYLGSNVARECIKLGHKVFLIKRESSSFDLLQDASEKVETFNYTGDMKSLVDFFCEAKADIVIHLAALFIAEHKTEQVDLLLDSNIKFSLHILEAMKVSNTPCIVNTSTSWQNYNDQLYNPACLYAAMKQAVEDLIKFYVESASIRAVTLTIYDTFGPNDPRNKITNLFKRIATTGESLEMSLGEQEINLCFIDDIVNAYISAMDLVFNDQSIKYKKYFLDADNTMTLKEFAKVYEKVNNTVLNIVWGGRPYREREVMKAYKGGERLPNWERKISILEGLERIKEDISDCD